MVAKSAFAGVSLILLVVLAIACAAAEVYHTTEKAKPKMA